jgi:hypothetical protein
MIKTAFSITRSQWKRYPVIETSDVTDLSVIEKYKNNYPYVWLKHEDCDIQPNFNWNFSPEQHNKNSIHSFPSCNLHSKRPVSWEVLRLVPTQLVNNPDVVRSNQIAAYKVNMTPMYIYAFNDNSVMKKYRMVSIPERPCHLINNKKSIIEVYEMLSSSNSNSAWLVHADVRIDNVSNLDYEIGDADIIRFPVVHQSTGLTYADDSVSLVKIDYIKQLLNQGSNSEAEPFIIDPLSGELVPNEIEESVKSKIIKTSTIPIGHINDTVDPFKAWANAYYTCLYVQYSDDTNIKKKKNKILGAYFRLQPSRVNTLIKAGVQQAEIDISNPDFDYDTFVNWNHILKRFTEWNKKSSAETHNSTHVSKKRIGRIKKIYGKDSEEYQKLSSQLGKSSL